VRVGGSAARSKQFAPHRNHVSQFLIFGAGSEYRESYPIGGTATATLASTAIGYLATVRFEHETERVSRHVGH
jgi:hypothetical protein